MKRLIKLSECEENFSVPRELFSDPVSVQGGKKSAYQNYIRVESGGRYKLFTQSRDYLFIAEGGGFFKWQRGETPFSAGEIFLAEQIGEYELNGKCTFLVLRK